MNRNILTVPVQRVEGETRTPLQDLLAVEEPLEIRLNGRAVSITMRTPGNDAELAVGFVFSEGILSGPDQIANISLSPNSVDIALTPTHQPDLDRLHRNFYTTSSCGVCGKASIEALYAAECPVIARGVPLLDTQVVHGLPAALRDSQRVFERTGGLHAAALFSSTGQLLSVREDVGRHNATDKVIGAEMLAGRTPCSDKLLLVSSRASFEIMQKALMGGIPILAAVGAPSSLAVEVARRFGMTLLGFVREGRFNIYSGGDRIR